MASAHRCGAVGWLQSDIFADRGIKSWGAVGALTKDLHGMKQFVGIFAPLLTFSGFCYCLFHDDAVLGRASSEDAFSSSLQLECFSFVPGLLADLC